MDTKIGVETNLLFDEITDFYYPNSSAVQQFKQPIKDEVYEYWFDPYELWYYYSIGALTRYVNNYYPNYAKYDPSTFKRNMEKSLTNYGNYCFSSGQRVVRHQAQLLQEYVEKFHPTIWDNRTNQELEYHIEYIWVAKGQNPCEICKNMDGKNIVVLDIDKAHWNCRCVLVQTEWYTDKSGKKYYESEKVL